MDDVQRFFFAAQVCSRCNGEQLVLQLVFDGLDHGLTVRDALMISTVSSRTADGKLSTQQRAASS